MLIKKYLLYFNLAVPVGLITRIYIFLRISSRYEVRNSLNNTGLCYLFHSSNCHLVRQAFSTRWLCSFLTFLYRVS